jgi:hypothetical protein
MVQTQEGQTQEGQAQEGQAFDFLDEDPLHVGEQQYALVSFTKAGDAMEVRGVFDTLPDAHAHAQRLVSHYGPHNIHLLDLYKWTLVPASDADADDQHALLTHLMKAHLRQEALDKKAFVQRQKRIMKEGLDAVLTDDERIPKPETDDVNKLAQSAAAADPTPNQQPTPHCNAQPTPPHPQDPRPNVHVQGQSVVLLSFLVNRGVSDTSFGVKVRGAFENLAAAEAHARELLKCDESHHIFFADMYRLLPIPPDANAVQHQEYSDERLNGLMHGMQQNQQKAKMHHTWRKQETMRAILEAEIAGDGAEAGDGDGDGDGGDDVASSSVTEENITHVVFNARDTHPSTSDC